MKQNEARPFFRLLAGLIALMSWLPVILFSLFWLRGEPLLEDSIRTFIGLSMFALALSWVAFKGFMPKYLLTIRATAKSRRALCPKLDGPYAQ